MMPIFGITPPKEIFEDLPEGVSVQIAAETWFSGYHDGHEKKPYHVFGKAEDPSPLQSIYESGYEQGERDRAARDELGARPSVQSSESEKTAGGGEVTVTPGEPTQVEEGVLVMIEGQQTKTYEGISFEDAGDRITRAESLGVLKSAVLTPVGPDDSAGQSPKFQQVVDSLTGKSRWNLVLVFGSFDQEEAEENDG